MWGKKTSWLVLKDRQHILAPCNELETICTVVRYFFPKQRVFLMFHFELPLIGHPNSTVSFQVVQLATFINSHGHVLLINAPSVFFCDKMSKLTRKENID